MLNPTELELLMAGQDLPDLASLVRRPSWMADAACRGTETAWFFPAKGQPTAPAKAVCAACPALESCRAYVLGHEDMLAGVWAGMNEQERRRLRSRKAAA